MPAASSAAGLLLPLLLVVLLGSSASAFVVPTSTPLARACRSPAPTPTTITTTTMSASSTSSAILDAYRTGPKPKAPLPPIILSNVPGTWAYDTMSRRIRDDILARIYAENDLSDPKLAGVKEALDQLKAELQTPGQSPLPPVPDDGGPDIEVWRALMAPYAASNWLDAPWLVTEFYFYRRVAQAFGYFRTGYDCFHAQKRLGLEGALSLTQQLTARGEEVYAAAAADDATGAGQATALRFAVFASLWGNKMDLSLWPSQTNAANKAQAFASVLEASSANLLADAFPAVAAHLSQPSGGGAATKKKRVDIIVDNAGFELITDLILADCLIRTGLAGKVVLHTKGHPTFVSDAMDKDVKETVDFLGANGVPCAEEHWAQYLQDGRWELHAHTYWAQPFPFWEMPPDVRQDLAGADLAFIKGDANYRRLLGDRTWALSTPFADVASYFPCPVAPLRTLKAELGCGMPEAQVARAAAADPKDWMVTGKYGVVQFHDPAGRSS